MRRSQVQDAACNSRLVSIAQGWFRSVVRDVVVSRVPLALQPTYFVGKLVMAEVEFRTMESRLATNHYQGRCVAAISYARNVSAVDRSVPVLKLRLTPHLKSVL